MPLFSNLCLSLALLGLASEEKIVCPPERTLEFDPLELIAGRDVPGLPQWTLVHEGIQYCFASAENQKRFEADRERYAVADGGACGRMGPLSGLGDARRHIVHEGKIYFFASDLCRIGFLKQPERCLERDQALPEGSAEAALRGRAVLDRLVRWAGGAAAWNALSSYRESRATKEFSGGQEYTVERSLAFVFPGYALQRESWNDSWFSNVRTPEGAGSLSSTRLDRFGASRERALDRKLARELPLLLKAHLDPQLATDPARWRVVFDGSGEIEGVAVDYVQLWLRGAASRLAVEHETGRPVELAFHGRDGTASVGNCVRRYGAAASVDGIRLPLEYHIFFDGTPQSSSPWRLDRFEINPKLPPESFALQR